MADCDCGTAVTAVKIVRGNDLLLEARVSLWDEEAQAYKAYSLDGASYLEMALVGDYGRVGCEDVAADGSVVRGRVCGRSLGKGVYGLEVTFGDEGGHGRVYEGTVLEIVESGEEATTVSTAEGDGVPFTVEVDMTVRTVRVGKSAVTDDYAALSGKPSINGAVLAGEVALSDIGAASSEALAAETEARKAADKELDGRVGANTAAITTLNSDSNTEGSVKKTVSEAVALIVAGAPADFDTLKEIADYIAADKTGAAEMSAAISRLQSLTGAHTEEIAANSAAIKASREGIADNAADISVLKTFADNNQMMVGYDESTGEVYVGVGSWNTSFDGGEIDDVTGEVTLEIES
jgi:hypothetical protein